MISTSYELSSQSLKAGLAGSYGPNPAVNAAGGPVAVPEPCPKVRPRERVAAMQRSQDRFLTTHTGSLPRPADLITMMYAKEEGVPVDKARSARG